MIAVDHTLYHANAIDNKRTPARVFRGKRWALKLPKLPLGLLYTWTVDLHIVTIATIRNLTHFFTCQTVTNLRQTQISRTENNCV